MPFRGLRRPSRISTQLPHNARSLGADIRERAARRVFTPPRVNASAICPSCGAPNAVPEMDELIDFNSRRCGNFVEVKPPAIQ
jgi:hypothetical protein